MSFFTELSLPPPPNKDALSRNPTEQVPTQFCNVITRNLKKKEETSNKLNDEKRMPKRVLEKPTPI